MVNPVESLKDPNCIGGLADLRKVYQMPFDLRIRGVGTGGHRWRASDQMGAEKGLAKITTPQSPTE